MHRVIVYAYAPSAVLAASVVEAARFGARIAGVSGITDSRISVRVRVTLGAIDFEVTLTLSADLDRPTLTRPLVRAWCERAHV